MPIMRVESTLVEWILKRHLGLVLFTCTVHRAENASGARKKAPFGVEGHAPQPLLRPLGMRFSTVQYYRDRMLWVKHSFKDWVIHSSNTSALDSYSERLLPIRRSPLVCHSQSRADRFSLSTVRPWHLFLCVWGVWYVLTSYRRLGR